MLALLAAIAGIWMHGKHYGDTTARAELKLKADAEAESNRLRARSAASTYEAQRAAALARLTKPAPEATYALHATICPPPGALGKPLELGDVPVPGVWLDRLRDAGADFTD